jgi:hypothetical protein
MSLGKDFERSFKKVVKKRLDDGVHVKISVDIRKVENALKRLWTKLFKRRKK